MAQQFLKDPQNLLPTHPAVFIEVDIVEEQLDPRPLHSNRVAHHGKHLIEEVCQLRLAESFVSVVVVPPEDLVNVGHYLCVRVLSCETHPS